MVTLVRPLRVTLTAYEPYVNECAVRKRTLNPITSCRSPGIVPEIFGLLFDHLHIPYEVYTVKCERV